MNRLFEKTLRTINELQRNGIIYLNDSKDGAQLNYEVIAAIVEDLNIFMDEEKYETLKNDKEKLLHEIILSNIRENALIYRFSYDFKSTIIKEFIDLDDPELICGTYCFIIKYDKLQELYEKISVQKEQIIH